jgi:hypothetical protein
MPPSPLLPTDDIVTQLGATSTTFRQPPIDGSLSLAQMVDWHYKHSAAHSWAVFPRGDGSTDVQHVTWRHFGRAVYSVARFVRDNIAFEAGSTKPVIAILANRDTLTYIATMVCEFCRS